MSAPVVIIGTGLAGYNLAREFRKLDPQTPLLLITADDGRSYSKPLLSTGFAANKDADSLGMATAGAMAEQLNAEIRTHTRVTRLDPAHRRVWIGNEPVPYRDLVLAWGAQTIRVPVEGDAADAVYPINDLHDYGRFRAAAAGKRRVLILGAGLIGCEFANDLLQGGHEVDLVAPSEQVMPGLLPLQAAEAVKRGLEGIGARFHLGATLERLQRSTDGLQATLSDGSQRACDLVVSAVGLRPRTELAAEAGLEVKRGIVVDRLLKTSAEHVYALGDCAEVEGLSLLYVMPLMAGARALAKTLFGNPTFVSYGPMPVTVKTPACPVVVSMPAVGSAGSWSVEARGNDVKALYLGACGELLGYALTGAAVQERLALNKQLPPVLAELPQILSLKSPN
ncbi:pyridine nucleotide-disulfide oxidoreductase family protein [Streptococcus pneumoniae]|uniref:NAD(P)/FAD-dependent oxidoreductase n=1 Tax=Stutzerimonas TaxID=2901164 RepID=UPI0002FDF258|nr:FAD-dependent oxidoreductase [Stutzerimonas stutzeri]EPL62873.1 rubredoxin reductase [Stutzerimonas stutzeri B1SMN1]MBW8335773.1 FAD-dependent oxidoreductase [Pseudomonas sp.]CJK68316.1 pyridine nucleotide-disulfide oxidoreductase family protein [Streptococcus pneumoniae]KXO80930.1 pyridine nucleotide-disulfide oxidoreductase [Stutzerimonas stutzeri]MBK3805615.1 FAD-dependent oxidoreductase [Stutzerimonas stutzeri]